MARGVWKIKHVVYGAGFLLLLLTVYRLGLGGLLSNSFGADNSRRSAPDPDGFGSSSVEVMPGGIPKIIHQTWSSREVPAKFATNIKSWVKFHPEWQYRFWTDDDNRKLVQAVFPEFLPTFDHLGEGWSPSWVKRKRIRQADAIRYILMYHYGGFYMDLDFEALQSLETIGNTHDIVIGQEPRVHAHLLNGMKRTVQSKHPYYLVCHELLMWQICNAILGSRPRHPFWLAVLTYIKDRSAQTGDPVDATGPRMMEKVLARWDARSETGDKVWVAPDVMFYPEWDAGQKKNLRQTCRRLEREFRQSGYRTPTEWEDGWKLETCRDNAGRGWVNKPLHQSLATHHWSHTWLNDLSRAQNILITELVPSKMLASGFHQKQKALELKMLDERQQKVSGNQQRIEHHEDHEFVKEMRPSKVRSYDEAKARLDERQAQVQTHVMHVEDFVGLGQSEAVPEEGKRPSITTRSSLEPAEREPAERSTAEPTVEPTAEPSVVLETAVVTDIKTKPHSGRTKVVTDNLVKAEEAAVVADTKTTPSSTRPEVAAEDIVTTEEAAVVAEALAESTAKEVGLRSMPEPLSRPGVVAATEKPLSAQATQGGAANKKAAEEEATKKAAEEEAAKKAAEEDATKKAAEEEATKKAAEEEAAKKAAEEEAAKKTAEEEAAKKAAAVAAATKKAQEEAVAARKAKREEEEAAAAARQAEVEAAVQKAEEEEAESKSTIQGGMQAEAAKEAIAGSAETEDWELEETARKAAALKLAAEKRLREAVTNAVQAASAAAELVQEESTAKDETMKESVEPGSAKKVAEEEAANNKAAVVAAAKKAAEEEAANNKAAEEEAANNKAAEEEAAKKAAEEEAATKKAAAVAAATKKAQEEAVAARKAKREEEEAAAAARQAEVEAAVQKAEDDEAAKNAAKVAQELDDATTHQIEEATSKPAQDQLTSTMTPEEDTTPILESAIVKPNDEAEESSPEVTVDDAEDWTSSDDKASISVDSTTGLMRDQGLEGRSNNEYDPKAKSTESAKGLDQVSANEAEVDAFDIDDYEEDETQGVVRSANPKNPTPIEEEKET